MEFRTGDTVKVVKSSDNSSYAFGYIGLIGIVVDAGTYSSLVCGKKNGSKNVSYQFFEVVSMLTCRITLTEKWLKNVF